MRNLLLLICLFFQNLTFASEELPIHLLKLPPHFSIKIYSYPVPDARQMALGPNGIIFVGTRQDGRVYAILPDQHQKHGTRVLTIADNLNMPNGVAYFNGSLFVAENNRILEYKNIIDHLTNPPEPHIILKDLPNETHHGWRYIRFGPDKRMYIAIGAPCNVCLKEDPRFASIMRTNVEGTGLEIVAKGVRNSVGFDWDPDTNQFWFTDNGRDLLGNNLPPDEINTVTKPNQHFGFPFCHGKNISDPKFGKDHSCSDFTPPVVDLPAHVAALGLKFYKGSMFPKEYHHNMFVAEHGSWNRDTKIGYQIARIKNENNQLKSQTFISGWLQGDKVWGRPVDLLMMPDGSMLISDDHAGAIYQVKYEVPDMQANGQST